MKPINVHYWNLYKESREGQETIKDFERLMDENISIREICEIVYKYDSEYFINYISFISHFILLFGMLNFHLNYNIIKYF